MKEQEWATRINQQDVGSYNLRLYITGASPNSIRAVENLKAFCEKYLTNNYQLEIIDVYQQPTIAEQEQIIALPLLIKKGPGSERRFVGDMSDTEKLLRNFNVITS